jgi:hypothetical protein
MTEAATVIGQTRELRLAELTDAARREQIVADALEALADTIDETAAPVAHFTPIWRAVADRLRADAREAHRRAQRAVAHIDDVENAIAARQRVAR